MKVAIIGSRGLEVGNLERYLPEGITEIVSGVAKGVDTSAREYALSHGLKLTEFLPEYDRYGRSAPLRFGCARPERGRRLTPNKPKSGKMRRQQFDFVKTQPLFD